MREPSPEAVARYLEFISGLRDASLVPVATVNVIVIPLGVEPRLVCHVRRGAPECPLLTLTTSDPSPVLSIHSKRGHPAEGRTLENRHQVDTDTWEYDDVPFTTGIPDGEFALRLSLMARTLSIPLWPVIPTLVHHVGWGRPINNVEVDAAVDSTGLAWAVTELVTGVQPPSPLVPSACERIRAAHVLADWLAEQAQK